MGILVNGLVVVMHANVLLLLDFVYPGGHISPQVLFGDNATEVANGLFVNTGHAE
jgi:hypothetical protein